VAFHNGTLQLPSGVHVVITAAKVTLRGLTLQCGPQSEESQPQQPDQAAAASGNTVSTLGMSDLSVITGAQPPTAAAARSTPGSQVDSKTLAWVRVAAADVVLEDCAIQGPHSWGGTAGADHSDADAATNCVSVLAGGAVQLQRCTLRNAAGSGVYVHAAGSDCDRAKAKLEECVSAGHGKFGYIVAGNAAKLTAGSQCRAENCGVGGFMARAGAVCIIGEDCAAVGSREQHGLAAAEAGTRMEVGKRCLAKQNAQCGFLASHGARMTIGLKSRACGNAKDGYRVAGGSHMWIGKGACATDVPAGRYALRASGKGSKLTLTDGGSEDEQQLQRACCEEDNGKVVICGL
jgi:hypothetical protein